MKKTLLYIVFFTMAIVCVVFYQNRFLLFMNCKNTVIETQDTDIDHTITFDFQEIDELNGKQFLLTDGHILMRWYFLSFVFLETDWVL